MSAYQSDARRFFSDPVEYFMEGRNWSVYGKEATVLDVVKRFDEGQEAVIVVDDENRVIGIITPSDFERVKNAFLENKETSVLDVMSERPDVAYTNQPVGQALALARRRHYLTGIPVVDRESGEYVGFLSRNSMGETVDLVQKRYRS